MTENNDEELHFCATKLDRHVLKKLHDIAFERHTTLKVLLKEILTNFANSVEVTV